MITEDVDRLNERWEARSAVSKAYNSEEDDISTTNLTPTPVSYEFIFELYRLLEYEDQN